MTEVAARTIMEAAVRRELFGPPTDEPPRGKPLDCSTGSHHFRLSPQTVTSRRSVHNLVGAT